MAIKELRFSRRCFSLKGMKSRTVDTIEGLSQGGSEQPGGTFGEQLSTKEFRWQVESSQSSKVSLKGLSW